VARIWRSNRHDIMDTLIQDIRYAVRMWVRTPGFTAIAVAALSLGIGANTAIFTVVNAVLIERLPYRDPGRLVAIWENNTRHPNRPNTIAPANFLQWRDRATAFDGMSAFYEFTENLTGSAEPEEVVVQAVTPDFFRTLGAAPLLGRTFAADEGTTGHNDFAVLSYEFWQRQFGGDQGIVGRTIQLNGDTTAVVGVMPPDTRILLPSGSLVGKPTDLWQPFAFTEAQRQPRGRYMSAIGRLKPGVSIAEAQAQLSTIASSLTAQWPAFDTGWGVQLSPLRVELAGELRAALLVLTGAVVFVLLIACANVANLLLARGAVRSREIAIRTALGAQRRRVMRQLLTESLVLGAAGGAAGLLVAQWGVDFLRALSPVDLATLGHVRLSYPVLGFTATVSLLTAVVCGFAPAFEGSRVDVQESLKDGARQVGAGVGHRNLRHAFVVSEIALAVVLLVGAGLMLRSFAIMRGVNPGFRARHVLTLRVALPRAKYPDGAQRTRFFQEAVRRIRALPGVEAAGDVSVLPLAGLGSATDFTIAGHPPAAPGHDLVTDVRISDNGFFEAMNVPLVRGRLFSDRELSQQSNVVVVNQAMARLYFTNEDPIGRQISVDMTDPVIPTTIIGIVGDARYVDLVTAARPMIYWPHPQLTFGAMTFTIRTASDPLALATTVERAIQSIDKDQPVSDVRTMDQWMAKSLAQSRFSSTLLAMFAGVALLLAAIGIYGVMSYAVSQRTSEIGIRLALGADERAILTLIVGNGLRLAAVGLGIGVVLAAGLSRTIATQLYETSAGDPLTFLGVVSLLGAVAAIATYVPARRASRIAPIEALRYQ
jgi:putative ABC transport system permease protein